MGGPEAALTTDGTRVYFTEGTQGSLSVWQVSVNGGDAIKIPLALPSAEVLDFSRVRSELLVGEAVDAAGDGRLWAVAIPAGQCRRVGEIVARNASWSHDGRRIAFVRGRDVYLSDEKGGDEKKLAELPGLGWRPRWSPDDSLLRLTVADAQQMTQSLWEVALDTGKARPLLPDWNQPHAECCGEWSDDGTYFFQATRGEDTQIWALPPRSGLFRNLHLSPVQVTSGQMDSLSPLPQTNRDRIFVIGEQKRGELVHYNPASHQFISYLDGLSADFVEFSRDGKWIAYVLMPEGTLWRCRADGTDRLQLTYAPEEARAPQWSPDGKRIVFHSMAPGRHHQDRIISREGGVADAIPGTLDGAMHRTWSPDGNELLYSDYPFFGGRPSQVAVYILDLTTRKVTTLAGSRGFFSPSWSPDGLYAAALAVERQSVMLFNFRKQSWTEIAEGWGIPHWSNDSRYLYFLRYSPRRQICRVAVPNGSIEEVADIGDIREAGSLAGLQFSLAPLANRCFFAISEWKRSTLRI